MKEIKGKATDCLDLKNFRHVSDLIYYEGPLLSYFQDKEGDSYLFSWVDCDKDYNRWLIIRTSFVRILQYLRRERSLRSIIMDAGHDDLYLVDIDLNIDYHHLQMVNKDILPSEYIPTIDKLYDYEPQNSEPEFLKKLESYGNIDGSLRFIGKFDVLNARTGLYRFEDIYSLDTSYGYFVDSIIDNMRNYTLGNTYIIVVDRNEIHYSRHKAADKLVSVESVI